jgi:ribosome biogenesis ATPase
LIKHIKEKDEMDVIEPVIIKAENSSVLDKKIEDFQLEQFQEPKFVNGIISESDNSPVIPLKIENDSSELLLVTGSDDQVHPIDSTKAEATVAVEMADFLSAAKSVQPSAKREGFAVVPDVTWGDVGALSEVREELLHNVLEPIAHPERFRSLGLEVPAGVLFFGPPGCGKTLLAKALANQSGANFISVKGPELLNMYVGESESRVRQVFSRARASAPCVIFFDELDALCPRRGSGAEGGSGVSERVVNQLLTELDGLETRKDVYIIAATNRLELIDEAMLRPGRLGKLLYVPLPDANDRISILSALVRNVSIDKYNIDIPAIGGDSRTEGYSGADLAALVREAGLAVVRELMIMEKDKSSGGQAFMSDTVDAKDGSSIEHNSSIASISSRHFEMALTKVRPSVAPVDRMRYERVHQYIKEGMGAIQALTAAAAFKPSSSSTR